MNTIEDIPNGLFIAGKSRIEQICSVAFKVSRSTLLQFDGEAGLDFAEQLLRVGLSSIFKAKVSFVI